MSEKTKRILEGKNAGRGGKCLPGVLRELEVSRTNSQGGEGQSNEWPQNRPVTI